MELTPEITNLLHEHYLTMRKMLATGFPRRGVQKSFEALSYSVMTKNSWRPTHISKLAILEYVEGTSRNIQRAHGVLPDRMDRMERTMKLLEGPELEFDRWWYFFTAHDKTVLITRKEHGSGTAYRREELVMLPSWDDDMFYNSGFSVKIRKKTEGVWLKKEYDKIQKKEKSRCQFI